MPAATLRALLARSLDYAGLFPPANLELEPALANHARYVRAPESWMLGAFVLPLAQFDAAGREVGRFEREKPLLVSALGVKTADANDFAESLRSMADAIRGFNTAHQGAALITQLEMPLPPGAGVELFEHAEEMLGALGLQCFFEAPPEAAAPTIAILSQYNDRSDAERKAGFKLRTGGVIAAAFPSLEQVAAALVAAARTETPIKFTAGLHHPVRRYHQSVETEMHGFLNVLGAGVLALEHRLDEKQVQEVLADEDPIHFHFTDEAFSWRDRDVPLAAVLQHRRLVTSFGSCSFDEPNDDLRGLQLMP